MKRCKHPSFYKSDEFPFRRVCTDCGKAKIDVKAQRERAFVALLREYLKEAEGTPIKISADKLEPCSITGCVVCQFRIDRLHELEKKITRAARKL